MNREWLMPAKILTGIGVLAASSFSQTYTVSAKPGAVNFIQGDVSINGDAVWTSNLKSTFLNANDVIAVKNGKAEVLLAPGVFLRLGENSQVRMIKPSLIETQVEALSGESMVEVDDIVPGSSVAVIDRGSSTTLVKPGLYRFTETSIATLDGKADVAFGDRRIELKKDKEVGIDDALKAQKVDLNLPDDLYAWSNTRAQYNAAASYAGSTSVANAGGYGYSSYNSPGWYWNSPYNSFMWLPGNGAFYSPFGWGFYGPGVVGYAPVMAYPYYGGYAGGYYGGGGYPLRPPVKPTTTATAAVHPGQMLVPVNPRNVGVVNPQANSPAAFAAGRNHMQQAFIAYGPRTASGAPAANLRGGQTFSNMHAASQAARESSHASSPSSSGGGWRGGGGSGYSGSSNSVSNSSASSMGGGHAGGGSSSGGHGK